MSHNLTKVVLVTLNSETLRTNCKKVEVEWMISEKQ